MAKCVVKSAKQAPRVERTLNRGVEKKQTIEPRRSPRLKQKIQDSSGTGNERRSTFPTVLGQESSAPQNCDRKHKRSDEHGDAIQCPLKSESPRKRKRGDDIEAESPAQNQLSPIEYWQLTGRWPEEFFEQDEQTRKYLTRNLEEESWFEKYWLPEMQHLLARKKSSSSMRGKQSKFGVSTPTPTTPTTPSDQKPREEKSIPYTDPRYESLLKTKGVFLSEHKQGITAGSNIQYRRLLEADNDTPKDSLFDDDLFKATCKELQNRNEAKIIQDISRLIVPSAQHLTIRGSQSLEILIETVNEGWNNSIPLTRPRPQPDYAVGFRREAFTEEQLNKMQPLVGELTDTSYFVATWYMYFPFLTCEVKGGATSLDNADRQNAHSMTLAMRGPVELFRAVGREKELNREILAFSIAHDDTTVRIYGHYPVIEGPKTTFYRHPIHKYDFTALEGRDKWTAYKFTKNIYDLWMPDHLKRLCSVIDQLPADLSFEVSQQSELEFQETGLFQGFQSYALEQSNPDSASFLARDSQASVLQGHYVTPETSVSQSSGPFKKPKKRPAETR